MSMADPNNLYEDIPDPTFLAQNNQTASVSASSDTSQFDHWLQQTQALANKGDAGAIERLFNYYATKESEKNALDWTAQREDNQYQRLVEDLRKAGISPYVISSAGPAVSSYGGKQFTGSSVTSSSNASKNNENDTFNTFVRSLFSVLSTAMMIALVA